MLVVFCQLPFFALSELAFRLSLFAFRNAAAALADADLNESTGFLGGLGGCFLFMFLIILLNVSFPLCSACLFSLFSFEYGFDTAVVPFVGAMSS
jgi:hypothetical protein